MLKAYFYTIIQYILVIYKVNMLCSTCRQHGKLSLIFN